MKNKIFRKIVIALIVLSANIVSAQDSGHRPPKFSPEQKAERMTANLKKQLGLSDDQSEKVKAIYLDHVQKIEAGDEKRKEAHQELEKNLAQILTQDQLTKFKTIEAERREQMRNRRDPQTQSSPPDQEPNQNNNQQDSQK